MGSYEDIVSAGFNVKDILDSYNQALKATDEDGEKKSFKKEEKGAKGADEKNKQEEATINKTEKGDTTKNENGNDSDEEHEKAIDLIVAEEKIEGDICL